MNTAPSTDSFQRQPNEQILALRNHLKLAIRVAHNLLKNDAIDDIDRNLANLGLQTAQKALDETNKQNFFDGEDCWTLDLDTGILYHPCGYLTSVYQYETNLGWCIVDGHPQIDYPQVLNEWLRTFGSGGA